MISMADRCLFPGIVLTFRDGSIACCCKVIYDEKHVLYTWAVFNSKERNLYVQCVFHISLSNEIIFVTFAEFVTFLCNFVEGSIAELQKIHTHYTTRKGSSRSSVLFFPVLCKATSRRFGCRFEGHEIISKNSIKETLVRILPHVTRDYISSRH